MKSCCIFSVVSDKNKNCCVNTLSVPVCRQSTLPPLTVLKIESSLKSRPRAFSLPNFQHLRWGTNQEIWLTLTGSWCVCHSVTQCHVQTSFGRHWKVHWFERRAVRGTTLHLDPKSQCIWPDYILWHSSNSVPLFKWKRTLYKIILCLIRRLVVLIKCLTRVSQAMTGT